LFGLAFLTRGSLLFVPLLMAFFIIYRMRDQVLEWLPKAVAFVAVSYLIVAPWTIRNYVVMHGFVPVSAYGWQILWAGTGPADGHILAYAGASVETGVNHHDPSKPYVSNETYDRITSLQAFARRSDEITAEKVFRNEAFSQIRQHPIRYISLMPIKFVRLWGNVLFDHKPSKFSVALAIGNLIILILSTIGCVKGGVDRVFRGVSMMLVCYITCIGVFIFACNRFTYILMPMLFILAAVGIVTIVGSKFNAAESCAAGKAACSH